MRLNGRDLRSGAIRVEYLVAAFVCAALLLAMTAVLMRYSRMHATASGTGSRVAVRNFEEPDEPATPVRSTVRQEPAQQERTTERPKVVVTEVNTTPRPAGSARSTAYPSGEPRTIAANGYTRFEAENYDRGGEGSGYHDTTSPNSGGTYRPDESVDISLSQDTEGDHAVSFIRQGEWLNYTVRVAQSGSYRIRIRAARKEPGEGKLRISFDGADKTGIVSLPNTGDYNKYVTTDIGAFQLSAGEQRMRVEMVSDDFNLNWLEFVGGGGASNVSIVRVQPIDPDTPKTSPQVQVQVTGDVNSVTSENFDEIKIGGRPIGEIWTWSSTGSVTVQQTPGGNDRCLRLVDISRTGDCWVRQQIPAQKESAVWHGRIRFSAAADEFGVSLMEGSKHAIFLYTVAGELGYEDGAGKWQGLAKCEANTWYELRIEANVKDDTFRLYLDNVQRGDSKLKFRNAVNEINAWVGGTSPALVGTMYIDSIKIEGR